MNNNEKVAAARVPAKEQILQILLEEVPREGWSSMLLDVRHSLVERTAGEAKELAASLEVKKQLMRDLESVQSTKPESPERNY